jgi:uncharacterized protein (DUF885 family)
MQRLIAGYLQFLFTSDPIEATRLGMHEFDASLGEATAEAWAAEAAQRSAFLRQFQAIDPARLAPDDQMDLAVAILDLETALRRHADLQVWRRAPYWYLERLGDAYAGLLNRDFAPASERGQNLLARLQQTPRYLQQAQRNFTDDAPALYVEMGLRAARGLGQFLAEAIPGFAASLPETLQADLVAAVTQSNQALEEFTTFLKALHGRAQGTFACGVTHFDFLLQRFHLLDFDHRSLYEFGLAQMAADRAALEAYAAALDPLQPWPAQIEAIKDRHPRGEDFLAVYHNEMVRARRHCIDANLITLPAGETCRVAWLPAYLRGGAPLGLMHTTPPFEAGLASELLITPLDPESPPERQLQHCRDNCYAFARSITLHEIYPGHHTQKAHHKLATAHNPMRRYFSSPVFVEGWGLYTEDLMEETGFMQEPAVHLFKLRNALWRSARVVVDSGLHTRNMSFGEAVDLLCTEVHLDRRMAEGEVRRYTTHNNPTYPSAYLLGKEAIHALRKHWQAKKEHASLKLFHDTLLGYGSPPVKLVAERMLAPARGDGP